LTDTLNILHALDAIAEALMMEEILEKSDVELIIMVRRYRKKYQNICTW
jgi:hypothetical protein